MSLVMTSPNPRQTPRDGGAAPRRRRGRGNAILEVMLILPVLWALSMGLVEFGYFFYAKHVFQAAARDAARAAILGSATNASLDAAITNNMTAAGLQNCGYTKTVTNASSPYNAIADVATVTRGTGIKVTVSVNFGNLNVRPLGIIPANKPLSGMTTMIKE